VETIKKLTDTPIFLRISKWFTIFFISDAIVLCSSSTSIIIFPSILTSSYTKLDFFKSLPLKLVFGLATLFISMVGIMMIAFSATCVLVYDSARAWAPVVVIALASIPITSSVVLHNKFGLIHSSQHMSRFIFRPYKHRLF